MKFLSFVALASMAMAAPANKKRANALDVKLEQIGNTEVRAIISNNGVNNLKVLKTGTILDTNPVEKVQVFQNSTSLLLFQPVKPSTDIIIARRGGPF